jgi:hypothetical protein
MSEKHGSWQLLLLFCQAGLSFGVLCPSRSSLLSVGHMQPQSNITSHKHVAADTLSRAHPHTPALKQLVHEAPGSSSSISSSSG